MATIFTEESSLYEVLIRVRPDGSWAAHYMMLEEVKRDGILISAKTSDVVPLNTEDSEAFSIVEQLIGNSSAKNMLLIGELQEKSAADSETIADLESHIYAGNAQIEELLAVIRDLQAKLEGAQGAST